VNDLAIPTKLSWENWCSRMREVGVVNRRWQFYVGDLLNFGIDNFGEKASQFVNDLGYAYHTLENYKYVSKRIPADERADVPFTVYQDIAALPKKERDKAVTGFLAGKLKRADLRALKAVTDGDGASDPKDAPQTALEAALTAFAAADVLAGKLAGRRMGGEPCEALLVAALDDLIAKAMALRAMIVRA
jgi:hypothetical protein